MFRLLGTSDRDECFWKFTVKQTVNMCLRLKDKRYCWQHIIARPWLLSGDRAGALDEYAASLYFHDDPTLLGRVTRSFVVHVDRIFAFVEKELTDTPSPHPNGQFPSAAFEQLKAKFWLKLKIVNRHTYRTDPAFTVLHSVQSVPVLVRAAVVLSIDKTRGVLFSLTRTVPIVRQNGTVWPYHLYACRS